MKSYTIGAIIGFTISVIVFILTIVCLKKDDDNGQVVNQALQAVLMVALFISVLVGVFIPIYWCVRHQRDQVDHMDHMVEVRSASANINYTCV
jgi:hypothetical protein